MPRPSFPRPRPGFAAGLARTVLPALALGLALACPTAPSVAGESAVPDTTPVHALAIHGGAGTLLRSAMTPERQAEYRAALEAGLAAGWAVLERGGSALDAVEAAVRVLEDEPLFNAGRGAVYTFDGRHELDASIMDGATRRAGAVAGVERIRNPVSLARLVMERSPHVMLAGRGAEEFARGQGVELVPNSWFDTERRREELERFRGGDRRAASRLDYFGTVGAVALDRHGRLAAATSTGGTTGKRWGRIGDSPVVGAGTWADDRVAVSATGDGEYFIRAAAAHEVAARVEHGGRGLAEAARGAIERVGALGGRGGVIAVDARGEVAFEFNSEGMYRAMRDSRGRSAVMIFRD